MGLLKDDVQESALLAYKILINVTATENGASCIVNDFDLMVVLLSTICDPKSATADEASKLLANMTRMESGSSEFLNKCHGSTTDERHVLLTKLIHSFCKIGFNNHALGLDYVAYILANITQTAEGNIW